MAAIKFYNRSRKEKANLTLRFRHYKKLDGKILNLLIEVKTNERVNTKDWKNDRNIIRRLEDIEDYLLEAFNSKFHPDMSKDIVSKLLHSKYEQFCNGDQVVQERKLLTDWFDEKIKHLKNTNKSYKTYETSKKILEKYNQFLEASEFTIEETSNFLTWLREERLYGLGTAQKIIDNFRLVCRVARDRGVKLSDDFDNYKKGSSRDEKDKEVIFLTEDEIQRIEKLDLKQDYLINARKWLILGCFTAQRGGDLLNRIVKENFFTRNGEVMIKLTQEKVANYLEIKALKKVLAMYESDSLPRKISQQKLNKYVKELCVLAKMDETIDWYLKEIVTLPNLITLPDGKKEGEKLKRNVKKPRPKHKYITVHCFRRTFCTLFDKILGEKEVMKFSGHKTITEYLKYVGRTDVDYRAWKDL
jgi:integrase